MKGRAAYQKKLRDIFDTLVLMCRHVEAAVEKSAEALNEKDLILAKEVTKEEKLIDKLEMKIEKNSLKLLVTEHPVASDFREVSAALKIVTDLERIGDQAKDIAKLVKHIDAVEIPQSIEQMTVVIVQIVKDAVQAFINRDVELARTIDETDDKADKLFKDVVDELAAIVGEMPKKSKEAMILMMIAKYLERIGDHAVNIGEWVDYSVTGRYPK